MTRQHRKVERTLSSRVADGAHPERVVWKSVEPDIEHWEPETPVDSRP